MTAPPEHRRPDLRLPRRLRRGVAELARATSASSRCATTGRLEQPGRVREVFPDRLINVGIAEQDLVGIGAGLANAGRSLRLGAAPFLTGRALEQIKADVAYSQPRVLCGRARHGLRRAGPHPPLDRGPVLVAAIAGLTVVVPADPRDPRRRPLGRRHTAAVSYLRIPRFKVPRVRAGGHFQPGEGRRNPARR